MRTLCVALAFFQVITYIPVEGSRYIGGTASAIPLNALGRLETSDEKALSFKWPTGGNTTAGEWRIPYDKVSYLGYGQHVGRRVGATTAATAPSVVIVPGLFVPLMWSKKRRHYLTIAYTDEQGKPQGAVFLVGKKAIRILLATLEVRTGKKVQYEDEEARKAGNK